MAKLFLQQPEGDQLLTELAPTQSYLIGRNDECSICIPAEAISSRHAQLTPGDEGWMLEDLGSSNGTTVNGEALGKAILHSGCQIILGGQVVLLFIDEPVAAAGQDDASTSSDVQPAKKGKRELKAQGASEDDLKLVKAMSLRSEKIRAEIAKVIIGQVDVIDQVMMVIIAGGHGLLVGMPGMAKTTLCATIAKVLDMEFKRVQFTPDLMPTDITGTEILEHDPVTDKKSFRFIKGPIFTNMLLADEINRTPPKTQASLLEAMQEKCVTVGNQTYKLDAPFFVLATQNPIEQEGTYPLPEAQIDRFLLKLKVDYPSQEEELEIIDRMGSSTPPVAEVVMTPSEVEEIQRLVVKIAVERSVMEYIVRIVAATRFPKQAGFSELAGLISFGASPRASLGLQAAARARAMLSGQGFVTPDQVKEVAPDVLRHRIIRSFEAEAEEVDVEEIIETILGRVPVK